MSEIQESTEYLCVDGVGDTRESALTHADSLARQYFGNGSEGLVREIGRAEVMSMSYAGKVGHWTIRVEYRMNR